MVDANPQTQRRVGFAVLLVLTCVVVLAQIITSKRHDVDGIDKGIRALADAAASPLTERSVHLTEAEHQFGAATGSIVVEPQAIVGLELAEQMAKVLGTPDPVAPELATLDEKQAATHAQALMARGKPEAALAYLARPEVHARAGRGLAVLARFAERWLVVKGK